MASDTSMVCGFDVALPLPRARLLAVLKEKSDLFNDAERGAYGALRDELLQIARKAGSFEKVKESAELLKRFIPHVASLPVVPETVGESRTLPEPVLEIAPEVRDVPHEVPVQSSEVETAASVAPSVGEFLRHMHGPDVPKTLPVPPVVLETVVPVVAEPEAGREEQKTETTPAVETVPSEAQASSPLKDEVEHINSSLIELGHGRAFQWLKDTSTGYSAYMKELLAVREALNAPNVELSAMRPRIAHLKEMAEAVRRAVGGSSDVSAGDVSNDGVKVEIKKWGEEAPKAAGESAVPIDEIQASVSTSEEVSLPETSNITLPHDPSPVAPSPESNVSAPAEPVEIVQPTVPPSVAESIQVAVEPEVVLSTPSDIPPPVPEASLGNPGADIPDIRPEIPPQEPDTLHTPEIESGLNDLLVRWLGTTGFLGFGDSGVKHPEWAVMQNLLVDDALVDDGTRVPGLRPDTYKNLGENIRAWRDTFNVLPNDRETVEHFIRRVVAASVSPAL